MKHIEIDEDLYQYLASKTQYIGESASSIIRRLLSLQPQSAEKKKQPLPDEVVEQAPSIEKNINDITAQPESVFNYINREELAMQRGVVGRFLLIMSALHRVHGENFSAVLGIRGRDRLYFARSEKELSDSGSSTKPRQIPESTYWVMTNSNTTRKKMMLTESAKVLGYRLAEIEKIRDLL